MDRQVRLLVDAEAVRRALPMLGRANKRADALDWIARQRAEGKTPTLQEVCAAVNCTRAILTSLAERGWVTLTPPPADGGKARKSLSTVEVQLSPADLADALIELRGTAKHRAVLEMLLRQDGAAWIGRVYADTEATLDTLRDLEAAGLVSLSYRLIRIVDADRLRARIAS
jgi:primosomal protein N'